jgi:hypothetical protein
MTRKGGQTLLTKGNIKLRLIGSASRMHDRTNSCKIGNGVCVECAVGLPALCKSGVVSILGMLIVVTKGIEPLGKDERIVLNEPRG